MKRTIAIVMALMMVITCVPGIAFAEGSGASKAGDAPTEQEIAEAKAAYERAAEQVAQAEITLNEKNDALAQAAGGLEHAQAVYEKVGWNFLNAQAGDDCTIEKLVAACAKNSEISRYITSDVFNDFLKSATSVESLNTSADLVDECNVLRAKHNAGALKINARLMIYSMVATAVGGQVSAHAVFNQMDSIGSPADIIYLNAENISWSKTPFIGWYDQEKAEYDEAVASGNYEGLEGKSAYEIYQTWPSLYYSIGHYLNIVDPANKTTGFGHASDPTIVQQQAFSQTDHSVAGTNFTTDQFRNALSEYSAGAETALENATATYDTAEQEFKSAQSALEAAQEACDVAYQQYVALATLPSPTGLRWGGDYRMMQAEWDWTSTEKIDHYEVEIQVEKEDGDIIGTALQQVSTHDSEEAYSYDFKDFFAENGAGKYSFKVKAIAKEDSGRFDSKEAVSDETPYHSLKTKVAIVDDEGNETGQDNTQGAIKIYPGSFDEDFVDSGKIETFSDIVLPEGRCIELSGDTDIGYVYSGVDFDHDPATLEESDGKVRFKLEDSYEAAIKIYKDERTVYVSVIFGEGHIELCNKVAQAIEEEQKYECVNVAPNLDIKNWPLASKQSDLRKYYTDKIKEQFEDQDELIDNGERWMGKLGSLSLERYLDEGALESEESSIYTTNVHGNGETLYLLWEKKATAGAFNVEAPVCGTPISIEDQLLADGTIKVQTSSPYVTAEDDSQLQIAEIIPGYSAANWYRSGNASNVAPFTGAESWWGYYDNEKFEGDMVYYAGFPVVPKFKYYIDYEDLPDITVNGLQVSDFGTYLSDEFGLCVMGEAVAVHEYGDWVRLDDSRHHRICLHDSSHVSLPQLHKWDAGTVTVKPTRESEGEMKYTCTDCLATRTEVIPKVDPTKQKGEDGTSYGKGASDIVVEKAILKLTKDSDPKGTKVYPLLLKSTKQTKTSVTLKWSKPSGAVKYVIYGNVCGKGKKYKKLKTLSKTSVTLKKAVKKIAKGKYYKFIVVALDENKDVVSTSKVLHIATKGGKVGNYKSVKTKAKKNRVTVSTGKTFKLAGKGVAASTKLKVKSHIGIRYESAKPSVATVSSKGVIKGIKKGTTYVYAYSQSGTYAKIKVTVK